MVTLLAYSNTSEKVVAYVSSGKKILPTYVLDLRNRYTK